MGTVGLFDMHCHLDFLSDDAALSLACEAEARGIYALSNTVTPAGFERAQALFGACENVHVGVGLRPWWVAGEESGGSLPVREASGGATATMREGFLSEAGMALAAMAVEAHNDAAPGENEQGAESVLSLSNEMDRLVSLIRDTPFVGEVGLDFASRHERTREEQIAVFDAVLDACTGGGKVISVHAVRSASTMLDMLEAHGSCGSNACILHWFSGASDELTRAIRLGCFFSVNPRMLATKRGRAYVRAIPRERLLLETDMPANEGAPYSIEEWECDLRAVLAALADARDERADDLGEAIAQTSAQLLER